jgi:ankyrin repeat protein
MFLFAVPLTAQRAPAPGELATAVLLEDISRIDSLLSRGADPDQPDLSGDTALIYAVKSGRYELVYRILSSNANPDVTGAQNFTPLMESVLLSREDLVILLLSGGADPNKITDTISPHPRAVSALSLAINRGERDIAGLLFNEGADSLRLANPAEDVPNPLNLPELEVPLDGRFWWNIALVKDRANSPDWDAGLNAGLNAGNDNWNLHRAARDNNWRQVRDEADEGESLDKQDALGVTALMTAAWHGNDAIVSLLLQRGADPLIVDNGGRNALVYAAAAGSIGTMNKLLPAVDIDSYNRSLISGNLEETPFYFAVGCGQHTILDLLLDAGLSPAGIDTEGINTAMLASWIGDTYATGRMLPFNNGSRDQAGRTALEWSLAAFDRMRQTGREVGDPDRGARLYPVVRLLAGRTRNPLIYSTQPAADVDPIVMEAWSPGLNPSAADNWRDKKPSPVPLRPGDGDLTLYRILRDNEQEKPSN